MFSGLLRLLIGAGDALDFSRFSHTGSFCDASMAILQQGPNTGLSAPDALFIRIDDKRVQCNFPIQASHCLSCRFPTWAPLSPSTAPILWCPFPVLMQGKHA